MRTIAALLLLAGPAAAQDTFSLPGGCTGYVTIQKRGCVVSHLFICSGDPAGQQRRVDMSQDGLTFVGIIDAETAWISSTYPASGLTDTLVAGATDPASFTTLLATGQDDWDFEVRSGDGQMRRYVGSDRITDRAVAVDGLPLMMTRFTLSVTDAVTGADLWSETGQEYIHPDWRTFLSGQRTVVNLTETYDVDSSVMEFAFPGEDGFLSTNPRYDCSVVISGLTPDMTPQTAKGN